MMGFVPALFGFQGRMRRRDFWFYTVLSNLGLFVLLLIDVIVPQLIFLPRDGSGGLPTGPVGTGIGWLFLLTLALMAWMAAALLAKRLHDRGRPGWLALAAVVPVIGWIWLFIECGCLDGKPEANAYGPLTKSAK